MGGPRRSGALERPLVERVSVGVLESMEPDAGGSELFLSHRANVPPSLLALCTPHLLVVVWRLRRWDPRAEVDTTHSVYNGEGHISVTIQHFEVVIVRLYVQWVYKWEGAYLSDL